MPVELSGRLSVEERVDDKEFNQRMRLALRCLVLADSAEKLPGTPVSAYY
jgi:hypothetical protein